MSCGSASFRSHTSALDRYLENEHTMMMRSKKHSQSHGPFCVKRKNCTVLTAPLGSSSWKKNNSSKPLNTRENVWSNRSGKRTMDLKGNVSPQSKLDFLSRRKPGSELVALQSDIDMDFALSSYRSDLEFESADLHDSFLYDVEPLDSLPLSYQQLAFNITPQKSYKAQHCSDLDLFDENELFGALPSRLALPYEKQIVSARDRLELPVDLLPESFQIKRTELMLESRLKRQIMERKFALDRVTNLDLDDELHEEIEELDPLPQLRYQKYFKEELNSMNGDLSPIDSNSLDHRENESLLNPIDDFRFTLKKWKDEFKSEFDSETVAEVVKDSAVLSCVSQVDNDPEFAFFRPQLKMPDWAREVGIDTIT